MPTDTNNTNMPMDAINPNGGAVTPPALRQRFEEGYALHADAIAAVPESALLPINLDVQSVVTTVTGAYHNIIQLRPRIAALPEFHIADIDSLATLAFALGFVDTRYDAATTRPVSLTDLATKVMARRDILVSGLHMLERRGLVSASALEPFRGGPGHRVAAFEAMTAAHTLRALLPEVLMQSGVTLAEINEATSLAGELTEQLGQRDLAPAAVADATRERQQVYTLVVNAYDQARRAVSFLLWKEGNVDEIAPSLYAGRGGRRRSEQTDVPPVVTPVAPTPGTGGSAPVVPAMDPRSPGMNPFTS